MNTCGGVVMSAMSTGGGVTLLPDNAGCDEGWRFDARKN